MRKYNFKIIIIILLSITISLHFIPQSFADGFQPPIFKLLHKPTICAFEPQSDPRFPTLAQKMLSETQYAVLDWQTKLNEGEGKHPLWNINLIQIPLSHQNNFDKSGCDILIKYEPMPTNSTLQLTEVGVTFFDYAQSKAYIIIYYLGVNWDIQYKSWNSGNFHYVQYTPVLQFTGYLASDPQLQETIRHEIGHSLGLGHYIVDQKRLHDINLGLFDPPSIMLTNEMGYGINHFDITPVDIAEVKSIYGDQGFNALFDSATINHSDKSLKQKILDDVGTSYLNSDYKQIFSLLKSENLSYPNCDNYQASSNTLVIMHIPNWMDRTIKLWANNNISDQELSASMKFSIHCTSGNPSK